MEKKVSQPFSIPQSLKELGYWPHLNPIKHDSLSYDVSAGVDAFLPFRRRWPMLEVRKWMFKMRELMFKMREFAYRESGSTYS